MNGSTRSEPRAVPGTAPPRPQADVATAAWWALPLPMRPAHLRRDARPHMAAVADFAAALSALEADATSPLQQRLGRLDMLELALSGAFGPALTQPALRPAVVLRESLLKTGGSFQDMLALADACRDVLRGALPRDAAALREHAARATAPVLRHFLLLHGERDEALLHAADDLARLWFLLRLHAAGGRGGLPTVTQETLLKLLQETAQLWQRATEARARAMLARLHHLAAAVARRLARGTLRLRAASDAAPLPPAGVLVGGIGALARLQVALAAARARA